jgi:transposase-like protein
VPKGQQTPGEVKLQALAELESGIPVSKVALKYAVTEQTVKNWKTRWEEQGSLDDAPAGRRPKEETEAEAEAVAERDDESGGDDEVSKTSKAMDVEAYREILDQLPAPLAATEGGRRTFSDDYKYTLARAVLARKIPFTVVAKAHNVYESTLSAWIRQVENGDLKGKKLTRAPEPQKAAPRPAPAPVPQRARATPPPPPPQAELALWSPPAQKEPQIMPPPPAPVHVSAPERLPFPSDELIRLQTEVARLQAENNRLRTKLRQALSMVIDDHE